jgi:signal peptidase I
VARTRNACLLAVVALVAGCGGGERREIKRYRLPSPSMLPTYEVGDIVSADLAAYEDEAPRRGDVVILHPPARADARQCAIPSEPADGRPCERPTQAVDRDVQFIQRVTGLPGEWLKVRDNRTYIARSRAGPYVAQEEPFVRHGTPCTELCNLPKPIRIAPGHYFVMGDNRGESSDSRVWGPVPRTSVIARVVR